MSLAQNAAAAEVLRFIEVLLGMVPDYSPHSFLTPEWVWRMCVGGW